LNTVSGGDSNEADKTRYAALVKPITT